MKQFTFCLCASIISTASIAFATESPFLMRETSEKMRLTFLLEKELAGASSIHHKIFELNDFDETVLVFKNNKKEIIAKASQPFFSLSNSIQLVDGDNGFLASLKETSANHYLISDGQGEIAEGKRVFDSDGNSTYYFYTLKTGETANLSLLDDDDLQQKTYSKNIQNEPSASIQQIVHSSSKKPPVRWKLFISESNLIHPLLLAALAAFDTRSSYNRFYMVTGAVIVVVTVGAVVGYKYYKYRSAKKETDPKVDPDPKPDPKPKPDPEKNKEDEAAHEKARLEKQKKREKEKLDQDNDQDKNKKDQDKNKKDKPLPKAKEELTEAEALAIAMSESEEERKRLEKKEGLTDDEVLALALALEAENGSLLEKERQILEDQRLAIQLENEAKNKKKPNPIKPPVKDPSADDEEEVVRTPIPYKCEQLIGGDDNFEDYAQKQKTKVETQAEKEERLVIERSIRDEAKRQEKAEAEQRRAQEKELARQQAEAMVEQQRLDAEREAAEAKRIRDEQARKNAEEEAIRQDRKNMREKRLAALTRSTNNTQPEQITEAPEKADDKEAGQLEQEHQQREQEAREAEEKRQADITSKATQEKEEEEEERPLTQEEVRKRRVQRFGKKN